MVSGLKRMVMEDVFVCMSKSFLVSFFRLFSFSSVLLHLSLTFVAVPRRSE